jgi:hypothetical protein
MNQIAKYRIDLKYILLLFTAVFASTIFHEYAHWSIGEVLGNKMIATLNGTNPVAGDYINEWNRNYITLAGPLFTVLQAILFYFLIKKYRKIELYPFLLFPFVMRFFAGLANFLEANDEGRLGLSLGIGLFTISILVCSFLFSLVYKTSKEMKIGLKLNVISFFLCSLFLLFLVFIDAKLKIKLA